MNPASGFKGEKNFTTWPALKSTFDFIGKFPVKKKMLPKSIFFG